MDALFIALIALFSLLPLLAIKGCVRLGGGE